MLCCSFRSDFSSHAGRSRVKPARRLSWNSPKSQLNCEWVLSGGVRVLGRESVLEIFRFSLNLSKDNSSKRVSSSGRRSRRRSCQNPQYLSWPAGGSPLAESKKKANRKQFFSLGSESSASGLKMFICVWLNSGRVLNVANIHTSRRKKTKEEEEKTESDGLETIGLILISFSKASKPENLLSPSSKQ